MANHNAAVKCTYPPGPRKTVFIHVGPPASGKTSEMKKYASENGVHFNPVPWDLLQKTRQSYWKFLCRDRQGNEHLFIEGYDLLDRSAHPYLMELASMRITVLATSQHDVHPVEREFLPACFQIIHCENDLQNKSGSIYRHPVEGSLKSSLSGDEKRLGEGAPQLPRDNEEFDDRYTNCEKCRRQLDVDCECRNPECEYYIPKEVTNV